MRHTETLIVGGGVIGCSIAYQLAKRGVQVLVVDQGDIGKQASSAAAGLLAPLVPFDNKDFVPFLLASFALFPLIVPELEASSGVCVEYHQTGTLRTISSQRRLTALQQQMSMWQKWGFSASWLDGDEVRNQEPLLSNNVFAGVAAPQEAQLKASSLVQAFARAAECNNVIFLSHCDIATVHTTARKILSISLSTGEIVSCHHLIIAAGAWSGIRWEQWLNIPIPVRPMRGEIVALQQQQNISLNHIVFAGNIYLAPKTDGTIIIGATKDDVGFDSRVTQKGINSLLSAAYRLAPSLRSCPIKDAWAGLRPRTPDSRPLLGRVPNWDNVFLATGHNAFGVTLSPLTGLIMAELVITGNTPESILPFSVERFLQKEQDMPCHRGMTLRPTEKTYEDRAYS